MTKDELFIRFSGQTTEVLTAYLEEYNTRISNLRFVEDMDSMLDAKEVIEAILKERKGGAK